LQVIDSLPSVVCMEKVILIKIGEIWLKGKNRGDFINRLILNIQTATGLDRKDIEVERGRIYLQIANHKLQIANLKKVFGIHSFVDAYKIELDTSRNSSQVLKGIKDISYEIVQKEIDESAKTFKVDANRAYKEFEKNSMEINEELGASVLDKFPKLSVDVKNPDFILRVEVRQEGIFIYSNRDEIEGKGGLPVGTGGAGLLMLSGGIDSPVAGWYMMKRGMKVDAVHFASPPYTGEKAKEKVIDLCRTLSTWNGGKMKLFVVRFTDIQVETSKKVPDKLWTLLHRRFMIKIAHELAKKERYNTLISGESLGQVASQTIENIRATSYNINFPVLRPLIGFDKQETINVAKKIDTYKISILPYEDCCTTFSSTNPKTRAKADEVAKLEEEFDSKELIKKAIDSVEIIELTP